MPRINEITEMCRNGQIAEALELARTDLANNPDSVWEERKVGWALYYALKQSSDQGDMNALLANLQELCSLTQLESVGGDAMIFDNVAWAVDAFVKNHLIATGSEAFGKANTLLETLKSMTFKPSKGYSCMLKDFLKLKGWTNIADFIDWWNLDNLTTEDYEPFVMQNGKSIMSLAEQAYIAQSKALIGLGDEERIKEFLPKIEALMNNHPKMVYPGYFYGKLLMATGANQDEMLKVVVPFVRRKSNEFWAWQLLGEVFCGDKDRQLACYLRAVNCRAKEEFLGKLRGKVAAILIEKGHLDCARYHIDTCIKCYRLQGWIIPTEVYKWSLQSWIRTVEANPNAPIDYMAITNGIIYTDTQEAFAVVVNVDSETKKVTFVYGKKKRASQKLPIRVKVGQSIKINYIVEANDKIKIVNAQIAPLPEGLDYAKVVQGKIVKREDKDFAFLKKGNDGYYVAPNVVKNFNLTNNASVKAIVVFGYDRRREEWNWSCVSIINVQ